MKKPTRRRTLRALLAAPATAVAATAVAATTIPTVVKAAPTLTADEVGILVELLFVRRDVVEHFVSDVITRYVAYELAKKELGVRSGSGNGPIWSAVKKRTDEILIGRYGFDSVAIAESNNGITGIASGGKSNMPKGSSGSAPRRNASVR